MYINKVFIAHNLLGYCRSQVVAHIDLALVEMDHHCNPIDQRSILMAAHIYITCICCIL